MVSDKVKAIVCLGVDNSKIHAAFGDLVETIIDTKSAEDAVNMSYTIAEHGDSVLLSPRCITSYLVSSTDILQTLNRRNPGPNNL